MAYSSTTQKLTAPPLLALLVLLLLGAVAAADTAVPVANGDFEDAAGLAGVNIVPGWTVGISGTRAYITDVSNKFISGTSADGPGNPLALVIRKRDNVEIAQVLAGHTFAANRNYTVRFAAGNPALATDFRQFSVELRRADTDAVLASREVTAADSIPRGEWRFFSFDIAVGDDDTFIGTTPKLAIRVVTSGVYVYVDSLSVTYSDEA